MASTLQLFVLSVADLAGGRSSKMEQGKCDRDVEVGGRAEEWERCCSIAAT